MNQQVFDSHLHIIDPAFPLVPNKGYLPDPFTTDDYIVMARPFGVRDGAVVSGSFQLHNVLGLPLRRRHPPGAVLADPLT